MQINKLLQTVVNQKASDIILTVGCKPMLRLNGRLVRRICIGCKAPHVYEKRELASVGIKPEEVKNVTMYKGAGCQRCRGTGYRGRVAVFELMELDNHLREMTFRRDTVTEIRKYARSAGIGGLRDDGVRKIIAGITTIQEVLEITAQEYEENESVAAAGA